MMFLFDRIRVSTGALHYNEKGFFFREENLVKSRHVASPFVLDRSDELSLSFEDMLSESIIVDYATVREYCPYIGYDSNKYDDEVYCGTGIDIVIADEVISRITVNRRKELTLSPLRGTSIFDRKGR